MSQVTIHTSEVRGLPLNNYDATVAPTVNDDINLGYSVGSSQIDLISGTLFTCYSANSGEALQEADGSGSGLTNVNVNGAVTGDVLAYDSSSEYQFPYQLVIPEIISGYGTIELNFGLYPGSNEADATIINMVDITDVCQTSAQISADSSTNDHDSNDHKWASLFLKLVCGDPISGSGFVVYGISEHKLEGRFKINQAYKK